MPGGLLFSDVDFFSVDRHQRERLAEAVSNLDAAVLRDRSVDDLANQLVGEFKLDVPELIEGAISVAVEETEVDVTGDYRFAAWGPGPHTRPGIRASYYVPFRGDAGLFRVQPTMFSMNMPAAELHDDELEFTVERPDEDVGATKKAFEEELARVQENLRQLGRMRMNSIER